MDYLTLSRAARLAGVTRAELQRRIRRGEITTFEGSVSVKDLLRVFPAVSLHDDAAFERVQQIKSEALPKTESRDSVLPSAQVLVSRLRAMSETLAMRLTALSAAETLLEEVGERLDSLGQTPADALPARVAQTVTWFAEARAGLARAPAPADEAQLFAKDTLLRLMAAHVKLIPSGHDYFVEGNESILDASVRAGLNLSYGCASGNCGACKARLISGETRRIREHDYVLSEREKAMGYLLTCSHTAVTDIVIEAAEALSVADLPHQAIRASLRKSERISDGLMSLNVQTPRTQTLRFMSGQRVRLTLEDGGSRELHIASCPCNGRNLWFDVRWREHDPFSEAVFKPLRPGHAIQVEGPDGQFVLTEDAPEPAVFIAFGDGIAPIKSLIEHAVSIDLIESFHLYWDTRHPEGHHHGRWGRALTDALDNFRFTPLMSGAAADVLAVVRADHPQVDALRFYVAGPRDLLSDCTARLIAMGVPEERILSEITEA
jgi:CDP-4-dehydro-6-deoxyglucose reductase